MRRLIIDTNVYIDWFNAGRHEDILFQRGTVKQRSDPFSFWSSAVSFILLRRDACLQFFEPVDDDVDLSGRLFGACGSDF